MKNDPMVRVLHKTDAEYMKSVLTMANPDHQKDKIQLIEKKLGMPLKDKKLLEIGSGLGDFVATCRSLGIEAYGVEPHNHSYGDLERVTRKFMSHFKLGGDIIQRCEAERLPHPNDSFDVVFSYYVLEHVKDPSLVLRQSLRVLKRGGYLFFVFPNYGSFWEGHYGMPWLPFANKALGKFWVRLFGFKPDFIDTLQLINLFSLKKILRHVPPNCEVVSLGRDDFVREVGSLSFTSAGSLYRAKALLNPLKRIGILPMAAHLVAALGLYTPFYLTIRKKSP